jgi:hypothetical protein
MFFRIPCRGILVFRCESANGKDAYVSTTSVHVLMVSVLLIFYKHF